jgi:hypothetical protein
VGITSDANSPDKNFTSEEYSLHGSDKSFSNTRYVWNSRQICRATVCLSEEVCPRQNNLGEQEYNMSTEEIVHPSSRADETQGFIHRRG